MDNRDLIIKTLRNNRGKEEGYIADVLLGVLEVVGAHTHAAESSSVDMQIASLPQPLEEGDPLPVYELTTNAESDEWVPALPAGLELHAGKTLDDMYAEYAFLNGSKTEVQPDGNRVMKLTLYVNKIPTESKQFGGLVGLSLCFCDESNKNLLDDYVFLDDKITPKEMLERMTDRVKKEYRLVRERIVAKTPPSTGSYSNGAGGQTV